MRAAGGFSLDLTGRRIVVTGAASGIGAAVAALLGEFGAEVVGLDVAEPDASHVAHAIRCDLSDPAAIERAAAQLGDAPLHGLANVAGIPGSRPAEQVMAVNFLGLRQLSERLLDWIPPGGAIVNVASTAGAYWRERLDLIRELLATKSFEQGLAWVRTQQLTGAVAYDLSKEAVVVSTLLRAPELRRTRGIRVNAVSPGQVETPILPEFYETMDLPLLTRMREAVGGENGTPEQIAPVVAFLLSDAASWVGGADVWVDAGAEGGVALGAIG